jgi:hypothetical protein
MLRTSLLLLALTTPALASVGPDKAVYRLDFELTTTDGGKITKTMFSLTLPEERQGEAIIGDNIAVSTGTASERRNVGMQVKSSFSLQGTNLLLDVETELTERAGASTIHKIATRDAALAAPGKKVVVMSIDRDKAHTELTVTPTRLP